MRARLFGALAFLVGPIWIHWYRRHYRRRLEALTPEEIRTLSVWFDAELLDRVRVARVDSIDLRPRLILKYFVRSIAFPAGIALGNHIVLAQSRSPREQMITLFHELVHVQQYRSLGMARFCFEYIVGWCRAGWSYFDIPLEEQAFALQERFSRNEVFSVMREVSGHARAGGSR